MATKTFIAATENVDSDGDRFVMSGITIPDNLKVFFGFDYSQFLGVVTDAKIIEDNKLQLSMQSNKEIPQNLYPALGFNVIKFHMEENVRVLDEVKLMAVGLCTTRNSDQSIQPIN